MGSERMAKWTKTQKNRVLLRKTAEKMARMLDIGVTRDIEQM